MSHAKTARARYDGPVPEGFLAHMKEHIAEFGFPLTDLAEGLHVDLPGAAVDLLVGAEGFTASISALDAAQLHQTRESLLFLLDHVFPDAASRLAWGDGRPEAGAPPNLHPATVRSVRRVGASFLRVEMACDGIEALSRGGMHFSLLLPPEGRAPVWPRLNAQGRTVWPEGADRLHRAAYTFVSLDAAAGRFAFDVFEHEGGRATGWARRAQPGEAVAVTGPGGGDFPPGEFLLMAGDETALPAIRRILETSAPGRRGIVLIEIGDPGDRLEIAHPPEVSLRWILRGAGPGLWERLAAAEIPEPETDVFVWVAAEQALVRKAKTLFRAAGLPPGQGYFAAYWSA